MKKIINTTNDKIEVYIKGNNYTLEPKGFLVVPSEVASYWINNLHNFLVSEDVTVVKELEKIQEVKEVESIPQVEEIKKVSKSKK